MMCDNVSWKIRLSTSAQTELPLERTRKEIVMNPRVLSLTSSMQ